MSTEQNNTQTSQQYFEIRNELNRAKHGLRLATRYKTAERWIIFENEIYEDFYKYMFLKIRQLNPIDETNINITLTSWLLRLWVR